MVEVPIARAKNIRHDVGYAITCIIINKFYLPFTFLRRNVGNRSNFGAADFGLLTVEQTLVHLGHAVQHEHGDVHARHVRH